MKVGRNSTTEKSGGFVVKIDSDGPVFADLASGIAHGHPSVFRSRKLTRHHEGNALQSQDYCAGLRGLPLKTMESDLFCVKKLYARFRT